MRQKKIAAISLLISCCFPILSSGQGIPVTPSGGYTDAVMFSFTGADQTFTVPAGVSVISVKVWGAGAGGSRAAVIINGVGGMYYSNGGSGGFVSGDIAVSGGQTYTIMVGEGGRSDGHADWNIRSYGFGGLPFTNAYGSAGGGLSGIFTNAGELTATSWNRAVVIAGGGGGGELSASEISVGGQGGSATFGGGSPNMLGGDNTTVGSGGGGGGGGYRGGLSNRTRLRNAATPVVTMGEGGSSFIAAGVTNGISSSSSDYTFPFMTNYTGVPPVTTDPHYVAGTGVGTNITGSKGGNGLIIIQYSIGTLPVTLISFTNQVQQNKKVLLKWATSAEESSAYFSVERSMDGVQYTSIGKINAAVNSNSVNNYSFVDANPVTGKNYYRLKMVDIDEKTSFSEVLVADISFNGVKIAAYPNPAVNDLTITGVQAGMNIRIMGRDGLLLKAQKAVSNSIKIPITTLPAGIYIVQVVRDGAIIHSATFIKK